jgi:hypothetical protein
MNDFVSTLEQVLKYIVKNRQKYILDFLETSAAILKELETLGLFNC